MGTWKYRRRSESVCASAVVAEVYVLKRSELNIKYRIWDIHPNDENTMLAHSDEVSGHCPETLLLIFLHCTFSAGERLVMENNSGLRSKLALSPSFLIKRVIGPACLIWILSQPNQDNLPFWKLPAGERECPCHLGNYHLEEPRRAACRVVLRSTHVHGACTLHMVDSDSCIYAFFGYNDERPNPVRF